ncbi:MAG: VWA-like domain-containing protein [Clostridia bacterium]|nr:VWA-like domain-containing protein [Clostridia bacterium]
MLAPKYESLKYALQSSRFRLCHMYSDLAEPLYDMLFVATKDVWRISTNGHCIYFDPDWLKKLDDIEMDFMLSHIMMHIRLGHIERPPYYYGERHHLAADIVSNARLSTYGWKYVKLSHIGKIRYETLYPAINGLELDSVEAMKYVPFDPSTFTEKERKQFLIDSDQWWNRTDDHGESGIIVLSPEDKDPPGLTYDGPTYGGDFRFRNEKFKRLSSGGSTDTEEIDEKTDSDNRGASGIENILRNLRFENISHLTSSMKGESERQWKYAYAPYLDWKTLLNRFIQEEVYDYSFTPPDRRIQDSGFFLPDYNVYKETVRDVYFMVDTSGSVSDDMLSMAYSEICQALEQFNGALSGLVGFFDTCVHRVSPFYNIADIRKVKPFGGGGTDYSCIFNFINDRNAPHHPASIVVITDGEGIFPDESATGNIPVLWLITGNKKPTFGTCVRIT